MERGLLPLPLRVEASSLVAVSLDPIVDLARVVGVVGDGSAHLIRAKAKVVGGFFDIAV